MLSHINIMTYISYHILCEIIYHIVSSVCHLIVVYHGDEQSRKTLREYEFNRYEEDGQAKILPKGKYQFNVLITSYEMAMQETFILSKS